MRRVRATQVQTLQPIYVDLDACAVIARGHVHEQIAGKPERVLECTWLYFSGDLRECVEETPEELFMLPYIVPSLSATSPMPQIRKSDYTLRQGSSDEVTGAPV